MHNAAAVSSATTITKHPIVDVMVLVVLLFLSVPVLHRFLRDNRDSTWLAPLVWFSLVLHMFGSIAQNLVVTHIYNGSADYVGYESQGAQIAHSIHSGTFSLSALHIPGDDMLGLTVGLLFLILPADQLGAFFVFGWFAFLGLLGFYRAFCIALPNADRRRYALLIFLMPSLLYWPSAAGKEAVMMACLGLTAYGCARLFTHQRGGWILTIIGATLGTLYRPHESLLFLVAFGIAILLRRSNRRSPLGPLRWIFTVAVVIGGLAIVGSVAASFLHVNSLSPSSITDTLQKVNTNTVGHGQAGFGSSRDYSWSPSLLDYPKDVYIVVLQPLPWQAHGFTQIVSALENFLILVLIIGSWRRLRQLPRVMFREPYVMMSLMFCIGFIYLFSSLGNLGLLSREKVLIMPLLFVLLALPTRAATTAVRTTSPRATRPASRPATLVSSARR